MIRIVNIGLAVVLIALAVWFYGTAEPGDPLPRGEITLERTRVRLRPPQRRTLSRGEFTTLADKNLFHPDRVDPGLEQETAEEEPTRIVDAEDLVLHGIMITEPHRYAWISTPEDERPRRYEEGDELNQYRIERILEDRVFLQTGEQIAALRLEAGKRAPRRGRRGGRLAAGRPSLSSPSLLPSLPLLRGRATREELNRERMRAYSERRWSGTSRGAGRGAADSRSRYPTRSRRARSATRGEEPPATGESWREPGGGAAPGEEWKSGGEPPPGAEGEPGGPEEGAPPGDEEPGPEEDEQPPPGGGMMSGARVPPRPPARMPIPPDMISGG